MDVSFCENEPDFQGQNPYLQGKNCREEEKEDKKEILLDSFPKTKPSHDLYSSTTSSLEIEIDTTNSVNELGTEPEMGTEIKNIRVRQQLGLNPTVQHKSI